MTSFQTWSIVLCESGQQDSQPDEEFWGISECSKRASLLAGHHVLLGKRETFSADLGTLKNVLWGSREERKLHATPPRHIWRGHVVNSWKNG